MTMSEEGPRFKLTVAYDGRPYEGWQSQESGETIQDHLLRALREIDPRIPKIEGSGRTDAGVHALGQVAHFNASPDSRMDAWAWLKALNTRLPRTIRVMASEAAPADFHARFDATGKTYRYEIFTGPVLSPLRYGLAWHFYRRMDLETVRQAMALYVGRHDFAAFAANRGDPATNPTDTHRTIYEATLTGDGEDLAFTFYGNGFMYRMVRLLVGATVYCGEGKISLDDIRALLTGSKAKKSPLAAPPDGLYLVRVHYGVGSLPEAGIT